jgi:phage terminase large subunit GpA-like protein
MTREAAIFAEAFAAGCLPEPELTVDAWADQFRILSPEESNEPGRWKTARVPFMREILERLSVMDPVQEVVLQKGAQIGGTQAAICWIGYIMAHAPAPTMFFAPTRELAQQTSRLRIDPMISSTPALRARVARQRSRDSRNTTFNKAFLGGELMMRGANSGAAFRNISARNVILDDLDGFPGEVGREGDPVTLIKKRTATFANRKILYESTPTLRGLSMIEELYKLGDRRRYCFPCPECGRMDYLTWQRMGDHAAKKDPGHYFIEWDGDQPETARAVCGAPGCGARITEDMKPQLFALAKWVPTATPRPFITSYHLPGLWSPPGWQSWAEQVEEWIRSQGHPLRLRGFINTVLAETYEDRGAGAEPESILERAQREGSYPAEVPNGVGLLTAAVDVHPDRLEVKVKGWGAGEESWLIALNVIEGDVETDKVWFALDEFLRRTFVHESGQKLPISCTAIDAGFQSDIVYRFCKNRQGRRVHAVRGGQAQGEPVVGRATTHNRYRARLYTLCTDTAKDIIYGRLAIANPGPGYLHFPTSIDAEYAAQLTAEKGLWKYVRGRGTVRQWTKTRERNEALDLEVYALAALYILGEPVIRNLKHRAEQAAVPIPKPGGPPYSSPPPAAPAPRRGPARPLRAGWVRGWRR